MRRAILCLSLVALIVIIVTLSCNFAVNSNSAGRTFYSAREVPVRKTAILLGTGPYSWYTKGPNMFYWNRINATAELFRKGKFKTLIISGTKRTGYDEPSIIKSDLVKVGIPDSVMILDGQGYNTKLSMENAKNIYNQDSVIVISQKWHNQRGIYLADHIGIDAIGYNAADVNTMAAHITHAREILARVKLVLSLL